MSLLSKANILDFSKIRQIDALWRSSFWLLVMRVFNLGAALALSILLSRHLGVEQYGVFAFGLSVLMLAAVPARFGFDLYLASEIPPLEKGGCLGEVRGLVRRAYQTTASMSAILLALWCLLWLVIPEILPRTLWLSGSIALCALPFFALMSTRFGALRGQHRTIAGQFPLFVLHPLLALAAFGAIVFFGALALDGISAQIVHTLTFLFACIFVFSVLRPSLDEKFRTQTPSYATRKWLTGAAPMMLAGGLAILIGSAGILLLGPMAGESAAGLYQPATQLSAFVALMLTIVNQPLGPRIAQLYAERRFPELQQLINQVSSACLAFAGAVAAVFFFWGPEVLSLYGKEFSAAAPALAILAAGQLANVAFGPTALILMMTGSAALVAKLMTAGATLCVVLSLLLIPAHGVIGAAIGASTALIAWNALASWLVLKKTGLFSSVLLRILPVSSAAREIG